MSRCGRCEAPIIFARTEADPETGKSKMMPVDPPERVPEGMVRNVALFVFASGAASVKVLHKGQTLADVDPNDLGAVLTVAHFATCPGKSTAERIKAGEIPGVVAFPNRNDRAARRKP